MAIWKSALVFGFLASVIQVTFSQRFVLGSCPTAPPSATYTSALLSSTWYMYARTPSLHDHSFRCTTVTIAVSTTTVSTAVFSAFKTNGGRAVTTTGILGFPSGTSVGTFTITIPANFLKVVPTTYTVIAINDPATYAVLYSCKNIGIGRLENVIILLAARPPTAAAVTSALNALATLGISTTDLKYIDQASC